MLYTVVKAISRMINEPEGGSASGTETDVGLLAGAAANVAGAQSKVNIRYSKGAGVAFALALERAKAHYLYI